MYSLTVIVNRKGDQFEDELLILRHGFQLFRQADLLIDLALFKAVRGGQIVPHFKNLRQRRVHTQKDLRKQQMGKADGRDRLAHRLHHIAHVVLRDIQSFLKLPVAPRAAGDLLVLRGRQGTL